MKMIRYSVAVSGLAISSLCASASGQQYVTDRTPPGLRIYYNHPYVYSWGPRYDPYWSYKSSYYPQTYGGDGSYYGMGYSGYAGNGWYGSYWYW